MEAYKDSLTKWETGYPIFIPGHINADIVDDWRQDIDKMDKVAEKHISVFKSERFLITMLKDVYRLRL